MKVYLAHPDCDPADLHAAVMLADMYAVDIETLVTWVKDYLGTPSLFISWRLYLADRLAELDGRKVSHK